MPTSVSGSDTSVGTAPRDSSSAAARRTASLIAGSFAVERYSLGTPTRRPSHRTPRLGSVAAIDSTARVELVESKRSSPAIASRIAAASRTLRVSGPT